MGVAGVVTFGVVTFGAVPTFLGTELHLWNVAGVDLQ